MEPETGKALVLYPDPQGYVTVVCPKCDVTRKTEAKGLKKASEGFNIRCRCGEIFKARVEFRKHYRRAVALGGVYRNVRTGRQGQMVVEDISQAGVGFRTLSRNDLAPGDSLDLSFNLDDRKGSRISLVVDVKRVQDRFVGTEIKKESRGNRDLNFYLMA